MLMEQRDSGGLSRGWGLGELSACPWQGWRGHGWARQQPGVRVKETWPRSQADSWRRASWKRQGQGAGGGRGSRRGHRRPCSFLALLSLPLGASVAASAKEAAGPPATPAHLLLDLGLGPGLGPLQTLLLQLLLQPHRLLPQPACWGDGTKGWRGPQRLPGSPSSSAHRLSALIQHLTASWHPLPLPRDSAPTCRSSLQHCAPRPQPGKTKPSPLSMVLQVQVVLSSSSGLSSPHHCHRPSLYSRC